jgi:hypothetical protein
MIQKHNTQKFTDDELLEQYRITPQLSKLSCHFDVPDVTIWRRAKKIGILFKSGGLNEKIDLNEILEGKHPQYQTFKLKKRLLKENVLENKCVVCGIKEWNKKYISLQLDHIDGNGHNHKLENLRLVCPNCHSQTDTYCGKNK